VLDAVLPPHRDRDELAEARELLAYWETRARRLPRWALMRRREAREMARRWRVRVHAAEQAHYGRGVLGAAALLATERRAPVRLVHRGRQAVRVAAYTAVIAAVTVLAVLITAAALVADALLRVL
jgi:hypothetical protein